MVTKKCCWNTCTVVTSLHSVADQFANRAINAPKHLAGVPETGVR